ncbi:MAG: chemotaxis protein CheX [Oligoflexia bacterium]|nr:chemotaxis protein CheX [Oligoflexia bacterium]
MPKILVATPDAEELELILQTLAREKHAVTRATNAQEALSRLRTEKFDAIFSDTRMPRLSGTDLVNALMTLTINTETPVVAMSAHEEDFQLLLITHAKEKIHFLTKPLTIEAIVKSLRAALPSKLNVDFVNPVLDATIHTISSMTGLAVNPGKPYVKKRGEPSGDISGIVGVTSAGFKGTIALTFPSTTFLTVVSKMLGMEFTEINEENKDAVTELLNIIFGQARKTLNARGLGIQSAIPTIITGVGHAVDHKSTYPCLCLEFEIPDVGRFKVEVCVRA